jgi:ferredoxin-thioredoxin reductase catalytic subunit
MRKPWFLQKTALAQAVRLTLVVATARVGMDRALCRHTTGHAQAVRSMQVPGIVEESRA